MLQLDLVGMGTGNPEHITLQAIRVLNQADLVLIPNKGKNKAALLSARKNILSEVIRPTGPKVVEFTIPERDAQPTYRESVYAWHRHIANIWLDQIRVHLGAEGKVALLVWGDPSVYDSSIRLASKLSHSLAISVQVTPGISSIQGLTAAFGIPLNEVASSVWITTGRNLRHQQWLPDRTTTVVMLDGECSFTKISNKRLRIWWGAYVGMQEQCLIHGVLEDVEKDIVTARRQLRAQHGWVMDIYMLRD
ncbi:MAG: precorrin-6A synthase (deacetylating) [Myxococcales bacterium]|nr:precorrin-6A synthase (deacetylating) [Myxococcales bacterium]